MTLGNNIIVSEVSLGTTVYGCYVETISGVTTSFFNNRFMRDHTTANIYTSPSVQGQQPYGFEGGGGEGIGTYLGDAYIPYYGISGKAISGVCFKGKGLDPINGNQAFNGRPPSPVEGNISYNNARVFNFQRAPTAVYRPFNIEVPEGAPPQEETLNNYRQHNIRVTNKYLIGDNRAHEFKHGEPCVVCYIINPQDAHINNNFGTKIPFTRVEDQISPPSSGISGYYKNGGGGGECDLGLSGTVTGWTKYQNTTVHMYKIKVGADFNYTMFSDGDYIAAHNDYVEEITPVDPLFDLYNDIVHPTGEHYTATISGAGVDPQTREPRVDDRHAHSFETGSSFNTFFIGSGICDAFDPQHMYVDNPARWTLGSGAFSLNIDVTLPKVGFGSIPRMRMESNLLFSNFARWNGCVVGLNCEIYNDYPGLGDPALMFLNFLDTKNRPSQVTLEDGTFDYTSTSEEGNAFSGVFIRPSTTIQQSNYVFIVPGDCA